MIVLLDTNVIMDALQERTPFDVYAKEILLRGQRGEVDCYFTANAATDIFYLYSKARSVESAKSVLSFLLKAYHVVSIDHEDCLAALKLPIDDFEGALVVACGSKINADYIVTGDKEFLKATADVKLISPDKFLEICYDWKNM